MSIYKFLCTRFPVCNHKRWSRCPIHLRCRDGVTEIGWTTALSPTLSVLVSRLLIILCFIDCVHRPIALNSSCSPMRLLASESPASSLALSTHLTITSFIASKHNENRKRSFVVPISVKCIAVEFSNRRQGMSDYDQVASPSRDQKTRPLFPLSTCST